MAIRVKAKKAPKGTGHRRKKKATRHAKPSHAHGNASTTAHATPTKSLLARKPPHHARAKKPFVHKAALPVSAKPDHAREHKPEREFVVSPAPLIGRGSAAKRKKKKQVVLRFTENTLKDIAALECVRRCFR